MLKSKILKTRKLNNDETQYTTQIYKEKSSMTTKEVTALLDKIRLKGEEKYGNDFSVPLIRVLLGDKWVSFKDPRHTDVDDYYEGKVADTDKFDHVFQMQITTIF